MPKEVIHPSVPRSEGEPIGDVAVHWDRDTQVQVSVTRHEGGDAPKWSIHSEPLTRVQINDLIRVLRRARDQAYGRDE